MNVVEIVWLVQYSGTVLPNVLNTVPTKSGYAEGATTPDADRFFIGGNMNNDNYITIQGWMRKELNLKGNELMVYALIYGFSQDGETKFTGSVAYIADWIGASRQTVHNSLKSLIDKGYLAKTEDVVNGVKFCKYVAILHPIKNFDRNMSKNLTGGSQKNGHNNIDNIYNKKNSISCRPSIEEVKEYCKERKNHIDPEAFIDYYAQQGWKLSNGNPMKDWKAAVRTWERRNKPKDEIKPKRYKEFKPDKTVDAVEMPEEIRQRINEIF